MIQMHVRVDDELHRAIVNAAHDNRQSANAFVTDVLRDKVGVPFAARPDTSVEDKANARASLTHATENRDA